MRKQQTYLILLFAACLSFLQLSCSKSDDDNEFPQELKNDKPGKIEGLGNTNGELGGTKFKLPDGISHVGDLRGSEIYILDELYSSLRSQMKQPAKMARLKSEMLAAAGSLNADTCRGSGMLVTIAMVLKNDTDQDKEVIFPPGLILKSTSGKYQNGVLLQQCSFKIPKKSTKRIHLFLYCGNADRYGSDPDEIYEWSVISNSKTLYDFCALLKNKKINLEHYLSNKTTLEQYYQMQGIIQTCLWRLTESEDGLHEMDLELLKGLPNM